MRIKEINIEGLFGMFTYNIPCHLNERITILHGPNGYGKTKILQMIYALFNEKQNLFVKVPFDLFSISFDNGKTIQIERIESKKKIEGKETDIIQLKFSMPNSKNKPFKIEYPSFLLDISKLSEEFPYHWVEPSEDLWEIIPDEKLSRYEKLKRDLFIKKFMKLIEEKKADWYKEITKEFNVVFIETQRLMIKEKYDRSVSTGYKLKSAVKTYSENLVELIQNKLAASAELSQSFDRTFPSRLVKSRQPSLLNEEQIREKLTYLEEKRKNLMNAGLLDKDIGNSFVSDITADEIDESTISVLNVYVKDTEDKLAIFDKLYQKINLFNRIINERFLNKKLTIRKPEGFVVLTEDGRKLDLDDLSSGEKHEIVLLYEMLFNVKPNFLILIDEPEISLHVEWQEIFLDNLLEIAKLGDLDIIIATHSPQIINDKWDLAVILEGN